MAKTAYQRLMENSGVNEAVKAGYTLNQIVYILCIT